MPKADCAYKQNTEGGFFSDHIRLTMKILIPFHSVYMITVSRRKVFYRELYRKTVVAAHPFFKIDPPPVRMNWLIEESEIVYDRALFVQQIAPAPVDGKRDIDELLKIRIVDHDDEPFQLAIGCQAVAMIHNHALARKAAVAIGMIERKRKKIGRTQRRGRSFRI